MDIPAIVPDDIDLIRRAAAAAGNGPRLFVSTADRAGLLQAAESGIRRDIAARLREKCEAYTTSGGEHYLDLSAYDADALLARPGQYVLGRYMMELAFGGWLWQEPRYTALAREIVLRRAREAFDCTPGNPPGTFHRSPLGVGTTGSALAWAADLLRPTLDDNEWADIVAHVRDYYIAFARTDYFEHERLKMSGFNKTLSGMSATGQLALMVAADLDEDELAWTVRQAYRSVLAYCREGMDDDGGTYEGPGYGAHCIGRAVTFGEALRRHGVDTLARYEPLRQHGLWLGSLVTPHGGTVSLGDSHGEANISAYVALLARWFDDPTVQWTYLHGLARPDHREGPYGDTYALWGSTLPQQLVWYNQNLPAQPQQTLAFHARGTGFVTMRSGWSEDDVLAVVSGCGRRTSAPAHLGSEIGHVNLYAHGRELLYDPGYGFTSTDAHSTVQVTGTAPGYEPRLDVNALFGGRVLRQADGPFASATGVDMSQLLDCRWATRDVMLVRGESPYILVADDLNYRSDWAEYDWYWQAHPHAQTSAPDASGSARIVHGEVVLDITSLTPADDCYPKPYETEWFAERAQPASWSGQETELNRLRLHLAGYNGLLLTVLVPRPADGLAPTIRAMPCPIPGVAATIGWDSGVVDTVVFTPYNRFLQTADLLGSGRLALVRSRGETILGHLLIDGYDLSWRGQSLVPPQPRASEFVGGTGTG
jgi:hypothetical protein